jgi:hypothetical protein
MKNMAYGSGVLNVPTFGGSSKWSALESGNPYAIGAIVVLLLAGVIIAGAIMLVWGLLAFLGTVLIIVAMLMVLLNRGGTHISWMFLLAIAIGVLFIVLSLVGVDKGTQINLRVIPGMEFWHSIFH